MNRRDTQSNRTSFSKQAPKIGTQSSSIPNASNVKNRSLLQSYLTLNPRTRIAIGIAGIAISLGGMYITDKLEESYPASKEDKEIIKPPVRVDVQNRT